MPPLRVLYEKWFRIETLGMENIPDTGGALLVANHSGTIAVDALMTAVAVREHHPAHRAAADARRRPGLPDAGAGADRPQGRQHPGLQPDAERLLASGELVSVFPEGFKGVGKPYSQRYKLQRFGRGGFVTAALETGVPIIPVSIVGAEEIYPLIGNIKPLAAALGLPYFPVTPTFPLLGPLGAIPLPSKWIIEFGEPIPTDEYRRAAPPTIRWWSSTSPTGCARRSSRRFTGCCCAAVTRSWAELGSARTDRMRQRARKQDSDCANDLQRG